MRDRGDSRAWCNRGRAFKLTYLSVDFDTIQNFGSQPEDVVSLRPRLHSQFKAETADDYDVLRWRKELLEVKFA